MCLVNDIILLSHVNIVHTDFRTRLFSLCMSMLTLFFVTSLYLHLKCLRLISTYEDCLFMIHNHNNQNMQ